MPAFVAMPCRFWDQEVLVVANRSRGLPLRLGLVMQFLRKY
jgi:hypothetical protein